MLSLFRKRRPVSIAAAVPRGLRVYAVGDVHGRADLLERLARKIEADRASAPGATLTLFLGDYVDRGLQSAQVLTRLAARDFPTEFVALRGNHEQTLLEALDDERTFEFWRRIGGLETLVSYRIACDEVRLGRGYERARDALRRSVPQAQVDFLSGLPTYRQIGDYFFCHAGVKPGVPLDRQSDDDLMLIREEFLNSAAFHGKMIVHGHTPVEQPDFRANRINIDTGAYLSDRLTCLVLESDSRRTIEA